MGSNDTGKAAYLARCTAHADTIRIPVLEEAFILYLTAIDLGLFAIPPSRERHETSEGAPTLPLPLAIDFTAGEGIIDPAIKCTDLITPEQHNCYKAMENLTLAIFAGASRNIDRSKHALTEVNMLSLSS